jgi:uncharacterized membrane protein
MTPEDVDGAGRRGERRLPMAIAVILAAALYLLIPEQFRLTEATHIGYPVFLLVLLGILIIGDPGRVDRESRWLRLTTGVMIASITLATAVSAVRLVGGILTGAEFGSAAQLLTIGAVIWVTAVIAFALWYWHLDCAGPAARANGTFTALPAFRFPEQDIESPAYAHWYPQFIDYLALSFNTATAFSPADVSAVRHWSKLWLICESAISLSLVALVVARAVNAL